MKKYFYLISIIWTSSLIAQPVVQSVLPTYGDSLNMHEIQTPIPINFGVTGMQTWDLSTANTQLQFTAVSHDPSTTPYAADFPNANFAQSINVSGNPAFYVFGIVNSDSLYTLGGRSATVPILNYTFINPKVALRFPMNYQDMISDISEDDSGNIEHDTREYVAYGNLTTAFGNYTNVILLHDRHYDENDVWQNTKYMFMAAANNLFIAEIDSSDGLGYIYEVPALTTNSQEITAKKYALTIAPNPSNLETTTLSFNLNEKAMVKIELFSVDGKNIEVLMNETRPSGNFTLPINSQSLAKGTYFIRTIIGNDPVLEKLVIK